MAATFRSGFTKSVRKKSHAMAMGGNIEPSMGIFVLNGFHEAGIRFSPFGRTPVALGLMPWPCVLQNDTP
jgi:hypothetical protein